VFDGDGMGGIPGEVRYDVPFGVVQHPNPGESFVAPLTHAFLARPDGGVALVSQSGSQSFKVCGAAGRIGMCMGKSTTSGGRRKLRHWSGAHVGDFGCDTDWYREYFDGELRHRFVVQPFQGGWPDTALPNVCRALAHGPRVLETEAVPTCSYRVAEIEPTGIRLAGLDPDTGRIVLCEMCGRETDYRVCFGDRVHAGRIRPFGIVEIR